VVKAEYQETFFDEMQKEYGSIEKFFSEGLGIDPAGHQALQDLFLAKNSQKASCPTRRC